MTSCSSLTRAREPRVLFLPTASGDTTAQINAFQARFADRLCVAGAPVPVPAARRQAPARRRSCSTRTSSTSVADRCATCSRSGGRTGSTVCSWQAWQRGHGARRAERRRDVLVRRRGYALERAARADRGAGAARGLADRPRRRRARAAAGVAGERARRHAARRLGARRRRRAAVCGPALGARRQLAPGSGRAARRSGRRRARASTPGTRAARRGVVRGARAATTRMCRNCDASTACAAASPARGVRKVGAGTGA